MEPVPFACWVSLPHPVFVIYSPSQLILIASVLWSQLVVSDLLLMSASLSSPSKSLAQNDGQPHPADGALVLTSLLFKMILLSLVQERILPRLL